MTAQDSLLSAAPPGAGGSSRAASSSPARAAIRERIAGLVRAHWVVGAIAAAKLTLHLATAGLYGFFVDELYFLACGQHLAWGYVDMPPATAAQAWLARALFGDSPLAIRLLPALFGAGLVVLAAAIARRLGGGRFAQAMAALAVLVAPDYLAFSSYLSMNSLEPLLWMGCALVVIRMIQTGDTRLWLPLGALAGLGLLNKHTMLLFGFALVAGLLATRNRRLLWSRHFLLGGAIALAMFLPNLVWMAQHHFPHLELLANIERNGRDVRLDPFQFLGMQALFMNPAALPLWAGGLWWLLGSAAGRPYRALGWAYLAALAGLLLTHGKVYYLGPAYPMLFAAGAIGLESWIAGRGKTGEKANEKASAKAGGWRQRRWLGGAYAAALAATGAVIAPTVIPLLPPQTYFRYTAALGIQQPKLEHRATGPMPQFFADRFGWPEMAQAVARAYHALPAAERQKCAIFGNDFGQSGAIDFYGPRLGLPHSIGGHLTNWLWGPRGYTGEVMLVLGDDAESVGRWFESVLPVAAIGHPYAMRKEHFTLFLCRRPRGWHNLQEVWPKLKKYD